MSTMWQQFFRFLKVYYVLFYHPSCLLNNVQLKPKLAMDPERTKKRKKSRLRSANWTVSQTNLLLKLMKKRQQEQGEENFDSEVWEQITVVLNKKSCPPRKAEQVKMRLKTIKTEFNDYRTCVEKPGWGWDSRRKLPIAPSAKCWDEAIEVNGQLVSLLFFLCQCYYHFLFFYK
jgi:Myb/SANT-like DNA-binding domain